MLTLTTGKRKWSEAKLEENCEFRRTDNVQEQISDWGYFEIQKFGTISGYYTVLAGEYSVTWLA